jgi:polyhydroxyalkanoate synthesis regulator phasin
MNRKKKIAVIAGAAAALAVAGAGVALGATDALSPEDQSGAIIDDAASELGVEPDALRGALEKALQNRVDEAVEAGRLTEEQGKALKERIGSGEAPLLFGGHGLRGLGPGPLGRFGHIVELDGAASFLGLSEAELRAELRDGKSLADIAKAEGKSVDGLVQALLVEARQTLDQAVEEGRLTEAQADEVRDGLEDRVRDLVNHEPGARMGFRGPFHIERFRDGPSFWGPRA